ncbi:MAG: signal peptidase II [Acidobacteria bacterium]|nr:signal peptidase II [Acidobacteriota bacterium]
MSSGKLLHILYGGLSLTVLGLDQLTKALITAGMAAYSSVVVIPGLFQLTLVWNRGGLFGLCRSLPNPYRTVLFTAVPALAIGIILLFQYRTSLADRVAQTGLALILGGAVGNLTDRLRLGHVIDFLDVFVGEYHWPAFNVADSAICVGVALLLIDLIRKGGTRVPGESTERA